MVGTQALLLEMYLVQLKHGFTIPEGNIHEPRRLSPLSMHLRPVTRDDFVTSSNRTLL